jgi:protein ImuB
MEIGGSLRLFGGREALLRRLAADLRRMGHEARIASAPTPTAALWLARGGAEGTAEPQALAGALGRLPLAVTRWPAAVQERLQGMGISSLAECLRLPRDGFARRFGKERLAQMDRAVGRCPDPRDGFSPPEHFEAGVDLPAESMDTDCLLRASEPVLARMEVFLRARQAGVTWLAIGFRHMGRPASGLRLRLVRPARRARYFRELLESRLDRFSLEAPVIGVDFRSSRILRLASKADSLFAAGDSRPTDPGLYLMERLRARLGEEAVHALCLLAEHRPESAWQVAEPGPSPALPAIPPRPFWLLEKPVRLKMRSGRPVADGALVPESGPERIETGWWDGHDVARDYYVACDSSGVRLWIFRDVHGDRAWYLHGVFG